MEQFSDSDASPPDDRAPGESVSSSRVFQSEFLAPIPQRDQAERSPASALFSTPASVCPAVNFRA
jgi:hypothetical protein